MSARSSISKALATKLALINGAAPYKSVLHNNNIFTKLLFWDELSDFSAVCVVAGSETREYHPGGFKWGWLNVSLKLYVNAEDPTSKLEDLLEDVERIITENELLVYDTNKTTTEILITSITTDEGLLAPFGVGEMNLSIRYEV
jgi:hypothetical protein